MKLSPRLLQPLILLIGLQFSSESIAQKIEISTARFGKIVLDMTVPEINAMLDDSIQIRKEKYFDDYRMDTFQVYYQGIPLRMVFTDFCEYETKKRVIRLYNIYCEDQRIITKSGIQLGDNKMDIIQKLSDCYLILDPDDERGKAYSKVILIDKQHRSITFHFKDNKLIAMEIENGSEEEC